MRLQEIHRRVEQAQEVRRRVGEEVDGLLQPNLVFQPSHGLAAYPLGEEGEEGVEDEAPHGVLGARQFNPLGKFGLVAGHRGEISMLRRAGPLTLQASCTKVPTRQ